MIPSGWTLENELGRSVELGWFTLTGVTVVERSSELDAEVDQVIGELQARYAGPSDAAAWLEPARRLYRTLGIDPSRRRPASEALLRRILQGKGLYRVNSAVDAANLASLALAFPVGLYDLDRIESPERRIVLRLGRAGESYPGIGKDDIHLEDRPCLVDHLGPFGNPSSDSFRTRVTVETRSLLFVLYQPSPGIEWRETAIGTLQRWVGGRLEESTG
ncbi:MAG: hypothetical protein IT349_13020 [Candidatus Eisenbacteria bacterium]|nr:hypothetical protein [Candidatus Eisenbacteria bacterium]